MNDKSLNPLLRSLAACAAATLLAWAAPAAAQEEEKVLNVYNWSD